MLKTFKYKGGAVTSSCLNLIKECIRHWTFKGFLCGGGGGGGDFFFSFDFLTFKLVVNTINGLVISSGSLILIR